MSGLRRRINSSIEHLDRAGTLYGQVADERYRELGKAPMVEPRVNSYINAKVSAERADAEAVAFRTASDIVKESVKRAKV